MGLVQIRLGCDPVQGYECGSLSNLLARADGNFGHAADHGESQICTARRLDIGRGPDRTGGGIQGNGGQRRGRRGRFGLGLAIAAA